MFLFVCLFCCCCFTVAAYAWVILAHTQHVKCWLSYIQGVYESNKLTWQTSIKYYYKLKKKKNLQIKSQYSTVSKCHPLFIPIHNFVLKKLINQCIQQYPTTLIKSQFIKPVRVFIFCPWPQPVHMQKAEKNVSWQEKELIWENKQIFDFNHTPYIHVFE